MDMECQLLSRVSQSYLGSFEENPKWRIYKGKLFFLKLDRGAPEPNLKVPAGTGTGRNFLKFRPELTGRNQVSVHP